MLDEAFPEVGLPLDFRDPYSLLIATVLSAQCTDTRVNKVMPGVLCEASTPAQMVRLGEDRIRELIRTCGLANRKARSIHRLSQTLLKRHGGEVPRTFEALEALPGIGHKSASVVMAMAFGEPAFPVDTHIHRLAQRWGLTDGRSVEQTEKDLKNLFPREEWLRRHLQLIYYGRAYCSARGCDGRTCPICRSCFPGRKKPFRARKA
ncbi:endonuclease III domain-containing protein [Kiritimatiella glycovorans]